MRDGGGPDGSSPQPDAGARVDGVTPELGVSPKPDAPKPEPDAAKPDAAKPDAAKPDAAKPDAAKPDAAKPDTAKPDAAKPDAAKPDASKPDASKPDAPKPDVPLQYFGAEPTPGSGKDQQNLPIGGGAGYASIVSRSDPRVKFLVDTQAELLAALKNVRSGEVIYIEGNASIDLSGQFNLQVAAGVTVASNRGENGAAGGRIYQNRPSGSGSTTILRIAGQNVRITGLRIEGPDKTTASVTPSTVAVVSSYRNLEVDNCEIWGWSNAAIGLIGTGGVDMKTGGYVHHNYIHHNQMNGNGYGVVVSSGGVSLIESNLFDHGRHAISGQGVAGDGYEARYNICGPNWTTTPSPHNFDMHGTADPSDPAKTIAGDTMKIHHNTFQCVNSTITTMIAIRGVPRVGAYVDHNWFYFTRDAPVWQTGGKGNIFMTNNLIGVPGSVSASGPIKYY